MISLHPQEQILNIYRKHWLVFVLEAVILVFIWLTLTSWLIGLFPKIPTNFRTLALLGFFLFTHILFTSFFITLTNFWLDAWILTSERLIDIEQHGFFARDISEFKLSKVQNINAEVRGFLATVLNFGDVRVETAGVSQTIVLKGAHNPVRIKDQIFAAHDAYIQGHPKEEQV